MFKVGKKKIYFNFIMIIFSINDTWMISNLKRERAIIYNGTKTTFYTRITRKK